MKIMPRRLKALSQDAPNVESSLDNFIARANDELVDVSDFDPTKSAQRELALKQEVDDLKQRLVKVQTRRKPSAGWGKLVIGYVLGCASIFAVSALMPKDAPPKQSTTAVTAPPPAPTTAPAPAPAPALAPVVTPIETAPAAPVAAAPVATPPVAAPPVAETPPPKVTKKARRPAPTATSPSQPQPPAPAGSADSLYNPF
jgi:hypothetical protein